MNNSAANNRFLEGNELFIIENIIGNNTKYRLPLNIIGRFTYIIIVLFFIRIVLLIPITILEILVLYQAASKLDWIPYDVSLARA